MKKKQAQIKRYNSGDDTVKKEGIANKAVQSLNNLKSSLNSINTAFAKDISGMRKFSKEIGTLSASMRSLSNIKFSFPDLSGMNKMLKSLKGITHKKHPHVQYCKQLPKSQKYLHHSSKFNSFVFNYQIIFKILFIIFVIYYKILSCLLIK